MSRPFILEKDGFKINKGSNHRLHRIADKSGLDERPLPYTSFLPVIIKVGGWLTSKIGVLHTSFSGTIAITFLRSRDRDNFKRFYTI
jgi:hypothetical protein